MPQKSLFIVIEGLDGSGKTTAGRELVRQLNQHFPARVKLTYEPHDPSAAGLFIRQILMKKITQFTARTLALAFATNRLDHCNREINPWLSADNQAIIISDRYYLSSLVYQSSPEISMAEVFDLNRAARKPDIIFFFNVSNEVCYQRMQIRNQAPELFESNLAQTREKYQQAIQFLRETNQDNIVEIDGNGTVAEVVDVLLKALAEFAPDWHIDSENVDNQILIKNNPKEQSEGLLQTWAQETARKISPNELSALLYQKVKSLTIKQLNDLFLDYLITQNMQIGKPITLVNAEATELTYQLPLQATLRGAVLWLPEQIKYEEILKNVAALTQMFDFLYVFSPANSINFSPYYEREKIQLQEHQSQIFPTLQIVNEEILAKNLEIYFQQKR
ncbi:MAG: dTMP kinase [Microscillaceae bacterium]|jgi:dTMP kinase|nr:dTMP kinase [Microscillaceae bacterium]